MGGLVEFRQDPADKRLWKLYHPLQPGGNHQNMFVAPDRGLEYIEAGEQALYCQFFGEMEFHAVLRKGEQVFGGQYERGMRYGTPLVSAGDGSGSLIPASRFVNAARVAGTSVLSVDGTEWEADQLVLIRTSIYAGAIAEAG